MKQQITYDEMVKAMLTDDARYDGKFYVCVRSTHIFCLPSCTAKQPKLENVVFHRTQKDAIAAGYRGCKRCRAEFYPNLAPQWLDSALEFMRTNQTSRIRERELSDRIGVDISTIRRYFRTYLDTTPMAFHRRMRLDHARSLIEEGEDYLTAAYECGFESASGFRDAFIKQFGYVPGKGNGNGHESRHVQTR
jgi:AraC family transcriptional regulator of adaptative response/methylated-DNA-[protein]-cysteine methyltransferase